MAKGGTDQSGSSQTDGTDGLNEDRIRLIVDECIGPHVTRITETLDLVHNARSSDSMIERMLEGFGELRALRSLLPAPRELDEHQMRALARINLEVARLPEPKPFLEDVSAPRSPYQAI